MAEEAVAKSWFKQENRSSAGIVLSGCLLILTVLAWPGFLDILSRDWQWASRRPVGYGLQFLIGILTLASWLGRRRVQACYVRTFTTAKHALFAFIALGFSLVFSVSAVEITFRLLQFPFSATWTPSENALAQFDPETGWSYVPNRSVVHNFGAERREVAMHFDATGARVRAPGYRKNPAAPTLLLVGDSFTMGHGLPYELTFAGQIESMPGFPLQVVNFGVQGFGTDQSLVMMKRHLKTFNTKVVVYTYIYDHLWRNAYEDRRVLTPNAVMLGTKPLFAVKDDMTLSLRKTPRRLEDINYSRVWASIQRADYLWGPKPSFALTRALVREMDRYAESSGAVFVLLHWRWGPKDEGNPFEGMGLNLVDTGVSVPSDFSDWMIGEGDSHPDARAHLLVAGLLNEWLSKTIHRASGT